jgi:hypothetical protein
MKLSVHLGAYSDQPPTYSKALGRSVAGYGEAKFRSRTSRPESMTLLLSFLLTHLTSNGTPKASAIRRALVRDAQYKRSIGRKIGRGIFGLFSTMEYTVTPTAFYM